MCQKDLNQYYFSIHANGIACELHWTTIRKINRAQGTSSLFYHFLFWWEISLLETSESITQQGSHLKVSSWAFPGKIKGLRNINWWSRTRTYHQPFVQEGSHQGWNLTAAPGWHHRCCSCWLSRCHWAPCHRLKCCHVGPWEHGQGTARAAQLSWPQQRIWENEPDDDYN